MKSVMRDCMCSFGRLSNSTDEQPKFELIRTRDRTITNVYVFQMLMIWDLCERDTNDTRVYQILSSPLTEYH